MGIRIVNIQQEHRCEGNERAADFVLGQNRYGAGNNPSAGRTGNNPPARGAGSNPSAGRTGNNPSVGRTGAAGTRNRTDPEVITPEDLEDTQSIIAEQRARIAELERLVNSGSGAGQDGPQRMRGDFETVCRERDEAVRDRQTADRERDEAVREKEQAVRERDEADREKEQAVRERDEAVREKEQADRERDEARREKEQAARERDEAVREREERTGELNEARSALESYERLKEASGKLQAGQEELEKIRAQISEMEEEKGTALEQLRELNLRCQRNLKYVEFYQKLPAQKIDGLELFRKKLEGLHDELREVLDQGLKKAYVFRSTDLVNELDEAGQRVFEILEQMRELAEGTEISQEEEVTLGEMSTEECKRKAEELLEKYEKTLKQMYDVSEKFLRIKNTIDFSFGS